MKYYFDYAATSPLSKEMKYFLTSILDTFGNPSSSHSEGIKARLIIENTRNIVSKFINSINSDEIYFTSSGSASNTLGINGYVSNTACRIYYSPTCHKSIIKTIESLHKRGDIYTSPLLVDRYGQIDIDDLKDKLMKFSDDTLIIFEYANSEIGTIQDVKSIIDIAHSFNGKVMVDCTGSISSIPLDVQELDIDIATFSGHKIGSLKGVGILYKKHNITLNPIIFGSQEHGIFAGTENVLGIASLGKAIELLKYPCSTARDYVWNDIKNIDEVYLIGAPLYANRLVNNLYICIKGIDGKDVVGLMDDLYNTQISTGSACNNGSPTPSSTLLSIGMSTKDVYSCIRISFKGSETEEQLQKLCSNLRACINILKS